MHPDLADDDSMPFPPDTFGVEEGYRNQADYSEEMINLREVILECLKLIKDNETVQTLADWAKDHNIALGDKIAKVDLSEGHLDEAAIQQLNEPEEKEPEPVAAEPEAPTEEPKKEPPKQAPKQEPPKEEPKKLKDNKEGTGCCTVQ